MEHHIGFGERFQMKRWAPITVILENHGRAVQGRLEITVTSGSEYRGDVYSTSYSSYVELPTNSKKRYSFTILVTTFSHPLRIQLEEAGTIILSESINLRPYYVNKGLAVMVSEKILPDYLSILPSSVHPVLARPQFLPESWYGYDGVRMLIFDADILNSLRDGQFKALEGWIKRGGFTIISSGLNYGALLGERARLLLPANIMGLEHVTALNAMKQFCGQPFISRDPFMVIKSEITDSMVLLRENNISVISRKEIDLGRIIHIAFDYQAIPFRTWKGVKGFWEKIYAFHPDHEGMNGYLEPQRITHSLISAAPNRFPSFMMTLFFLILYSILLVIVLTRLRIKETVRYNLFLIIIGVFSLASTWVFFLGNPQKPMTYTSFQYLRKAGKSPLIPFKQIIGLYTLRNLNLELHQDSMYQPFVPVSVDEDGRRFLGINSIDLRETDSHHILSVALKKWSHCFLTMDSRISFPLQGDVLKDGEKLIVSFENRTPYRIMDCTGYFVGRLFPVGHIDPKSKGAVQIPSSEMIQIATFQEKRHESFAIKKPEDSSFRLLEIMKKNIIDDVVARIDSRYRSRQDVLYLFGWIASGVIQHGLHPSADRGEDIALFEWEIPVVMAEPGANT